MTAPSAPTTTALPSDDAEPASDATSASALRLDRGLAAGSNGRHGPISYRVETHEQPYIVEGSTQPLEPGMCFSIEPGIYLSGRFGVRIEDIVAVTTDGGRRLNNTDRHLRVVA